MSGALAYRLDGSQAALVFQVKEGSCNTDSLSESCTYLRHHFGADKSTLVWDNRPSHNYKGDDRMDRRAAQPAHRRTATGLRRRSQPCRDGLGQHQIRRVGQPAPDTIDEAQGRRRVRPTRVGANYELCFAVLAHTGLSL